VTELWYRSITSDAQFPAAVRRLLCALVAAAAVRVRALNLGALLIRDAADVCAEQLELYRRVRDRQVCPVRHCPKPSSSWKTDATHRC
jgi:hypothetical protein